MRIKNSVDATRPYHWLHEAEPDAYGNLQGVNTIFLTNRECPFKCVMCDLWKNTLDSPVTPGAIPRQIQYALERLPDASVMKLYNNGNFFDRKAIPPDDYPAIADNIHMFKQVIVENHPSLCNSSVPEFRDRLQGTLEVAMGLETIHPEVLPALNKQMTTDLFASAVDFLLAHDIPSRAFILLNPPFLTDPDENIEWCLKSVEFAFDLGVECCTIIPVRAETVEMKRLMNAGLYTPPSVGGLEHVFEHALKMESGRVFVDLWDLDRFSECNVCFEGRQSRLHRMNLSQQIEPEITCTCNSQQQT